MSNGTLNRFFGGPPIWVIVRLAVVSLIVGLVFAGLGISPLDIIANFERLVRGIWNLGFRAVEDLVRYFLLGAVVVIPVWLILRILRVGRGP